MYGSRAANGVVFITTKKYDGGAPTIRYDGYTSVQTLYKQPDFLNAADVRRLAVGRATRRLRATPSRTWATTPTGSPR